MKGKDEVLVKMSNLFRNTWDKFGHILSHNFKSIKATRLKHCTTVQAIEIHILTLNKVHKKLHFLRYLKKKKNPLPFYFKSPICAMAMRLILFYTIQQVLPNVVPNFKILCTVVPEKSFDTNFPMYYTGVRDGKQRQKLTSASWFSFPLYTCICTWPLSRCIQKFEDSGSLRSQEICDRKVEIKGTIHNTTSHTQRLYPISKT